MSELVFDQLKGKGTNLCMKPFASKSNRPLNKLKMQDSWLKYLDTSELVFNRCLFFTSRLPARENSASSSGSIGSMASCTPSCPLDPPSAFSDSKELSETECDRVFIKASADQTAPKAKPKREMRQRRLKS